MPVAPAYRDYPQVSKKPFIKGEKRYIVVQHPRTGNNRTIRWYSESEYAKLYGKKASDPIPDMKKKCGFEQGPILIVRRNQMQDDEYLRRSGALYILGIGWYFPSTAALPSDAPPRFKYLLLGWDEFKQDETHMKPVADIAKILDEKAKEGQWIEFAKS